MEAILGMISSPSLAQNNFNDPRLFTGAQGAVGGLSSPFWAKERGLNHPKNGFNILLSGLQMGPNLPWLAPKRSPEVPTSTVWLWFVPLYIIWNIQVILGWRKGKNPPQIDFNILLWGLWWARICLNCPKLAPKGPDQNYIVMASKTVNVSGGMRAVWAKKIFLDDVQSWKPNEYRINPWIWFLLTLGANLFISTNQVHQYKEPGCIYQIKYWCKLLKA